MSYKDNDSKRDRRRRYFANVLNSTSHAVNVFGDWTRTPTGLYATGRISRSARPYQPGRAQMRGQRYINPSTYNPNRYYTDQEFNLPWGHSHGQQDHVGGLHPPMVRTQRWSGPPNRDRRSETAYNTAARYGQLEYNAAIRDRNQRANPSAPDNFFSTYEDNLATARYQGDRVREHMRNYRNDANLRNPHPRRPGNEYHLYWGERSRP